MTLTKLRLRGEQTEKRTSPPLKVQGSYATRTVKGAESGSCLRLLAYWCAYHGNEIGVAFSFVYASCMETLVSRGFSYSEVPFSCDW